MQRRTGMNGSHPPPAPPLFACTLPPAHPILDKFLTVADLNVGVELLIYARRYCLIDCDRFTRTFLSKLGVDVPQPAAMPADPYMEYRAAQEEALRGGSRSGSAGGHGATGGRLSDNAGMFKRKDHLQQFLENDGRVLRFSCLWDDTAELYGDERYMTLCYFLADDTIEITERLDANSGRDPVKQFMKRGLLPKNADVLTSVMGEDVRNTLLDYYTDADLTIGSTVNVLGRPFLIYDCDPFTRSYYSEVCFAINGWQVVHRGGGILLFASRCAACWSYLLPCV